MARDYIVEVQGLKEFQAALRKVDRAAARELTKGLRRAGAPVLEETQRLARVGTARSGGDLAKGYKIQVSGPRAFIQSSEPYGPGAEWGQDGKWSGFRKYGARGQRFAGRAVDTKAGEVFTILSTELQDLLTINGWAR